MKKVYNCENVYEIEYSKRLKELMKGIGEWRSDSGHSAGIKFTNPATEEDVNCYDFVSRYVETPKNEWKDMEKEERDARIKYLRKKIKLIVRTKGFLYQIVHDRTVRKIEMCAMDTQEDED